MGILTTQESARSFSSYVALFGLALLITSSIYLKDLNHWAEKNTCVDTIPESDGKFSADILCSNYYTWRKAAVIGIIIGVVDVLVVPFLICCGCCLVCGCFAMCCACIKCGSSDSTEDSTQKPTTTTTTNRNGSHEMSDIEAPTVTTPVIADEEDESSGPLSKFDLEKLPKRTGTILNVIGWTVWVLLPFVGSLLVTIWLYKTNAIRTRDDKLYGSALAVFVFALLNLMVYYQKFIDSICQSNCGEKKKKDESDKADV